MKPNSRSPRAHTAPQKTSLQKSADALTRTVTFKEGSVERVPAMRSRASEKMNKHVQVDHASECGDDAASSSGSEAEGRRVRTAAPKENYLFHASWETMETFPARGDKSGSTSVATVSAPSRLPDLNEHYPRSPRLVVRLPNFSAPVSMMPSPVGTPRSESEREPERAPRRLASFRQRGRDLSRELSRKLESISINKSGKSSASSSSCASTPRGTQTTDPLAGLPQAYLEELAQTIQELQNNEKFQSLPAVSRKIIIKAEILQSLPAESPLRDPEGMAHLLENAHKRIAIKNSVIDTDVDLNDPAFSGFVSSAAHAAFMMPWDRDASDVRQDLRSYLNVVKPTFARDFDSSDYYVRQADGTVKKLTSMDEFIAYVQPEKSTSNQNLAMVISNIASQNMGNFCKNALFLRQDSQGVSQSILKSCDGKPLMPLAVVKASYILSKQEDDAVTIDYTWRSSPEINGQKEMRAKEMTGDFKSRHLESATLEINASVRVDASGDWTLFNPHIRAQGWV